MMLSAGDRMVIMAALKWAAMHHDREAQILTKDGKHVEAMKRAAFSGECARLADELERAR